MSMHSKILVITTLSGSLLMGVTHSQTIQENIRLNADATEDHNETTIAINPSDPDNLIAGSHYWFYEGPGTIKYLAAYYSMNRGDTWGQTFLPYGGAYDKVAQANHQWGRKC